jgi:RimJ/RimL family protein N-acetyltransferase
MPLPCPKNKYLKDDLLMAVFSPLLTNRLILRQLLPGDRDAFFACRSLPEVTRHQGFRPADIQDADAFIACLAPAPGMPGTWFQLAVCLNGSGSFIGDIGMHFPGHDEEAGIGYTLAPSCWGRGYMAEALQAVIDYLFRVQARHRVTASVDPRNQRSVRVLERLGMRLEAHYVQSEILDGQPVDDCLYAMLREEWENRAMPGCL